MEKGEQVEREKKEEEQEGGRNEKKEKWQCSRWLLDQNASSSVKCSSCRAYAA